MFPTPLITLLVMLIIVGLILWAIEFKPRGLSPSGDSGRGFRR